MPKKQLRLALATAGLLGLCAMGVRASALGAGSGGATLGQPLDFSVAVRLGVSEALAAECLNAEVQVGDRRLAPSQLRVWVEPVDAEMARVRVQTQAAIDEPLVWLTFPAACGSVGLKRYVVLADPPGPALDAPLATTSASPAGPSPPQVDAATWSDRPSLRPLLSPVASSAAGPRAAATVVLPAGVWRTVALRRPAATATGPVKRGARPVPRERAQLTTPALPQRSLPKRRRSAGAQSRLRLDIAQPMLAAGGAVEQALQAVAQATATSRQAASAASAAADRIAALERTVDELRGEAQNSRSRAALLRDQLAQSESPTSTWLLGSAALALGLLSAWLAVHLSAARRALAHDRENPTPAAREGMVAAEAAERPPTAAMASVHLDIDSAPMSAPRSRPAPAWPPPAPLDGWQPSQPSGGEETRREPARATDALTTATSGPAIKAFAAIEPRAISPENDTSIRTTADLQPIVLDDDSPTRDVSIDELLDLEQQAEFFVVLGQDDAAIELLVEHLRHTGGSSPLPYLKLLEIHRRRGDRSDYERMRARFNHRFNAYAPEWEVDLQSGLSLEDYADVLLRVQKVWSRPQGSMAELEAMLFRKSQGELFDLPAYREVLFLYAMARDLQDREAAETGKVDVLLPLSDQGDFSSTSPTPFMELGCEVSAGTASAEPRSTAPVDLDLSLDSGRPASIFDPLQESPPRPRLR